MAGSPGTSVSAPNRHRVAATDGQVLRLLPIGADLHLPQLAVQQPWQHDPTRDAYPGWPSIGAMRRKPPLLGGIATAIVGLEANPPGVQRFVGQAAPAQVGPGTLALG